MFSHPQPTPPYLWFNDCEKRAYGSTLRLFTKLSIDLGKELVHVQEDPSNLKFFELRQRRYQQLASGEIDMMTIVDTDAVPENVVISALPYISLDLILVSRQGSAIAGLSFKELARYQGGISDPTGLTSRKIYETTGLKPQPMWSSMDVLSALLAQRIDYAVVDRHLSHQISSDNKYGRKLHFGQVTVHSTDAYIGVSARGEFAQLMPDINAYLENYRASGYMDYANQMMMRLWLSHKGCVGQNE